MNHVIIFIVFLVFMYFLRMGFNYILTFSNINIEVAKEKEKIIQRCRKKNRKHYQKIIRRNVKRPYLDINALRYEYETYVKIIDNIVAKFVKNEKVETNDMYLFLLDKYIRSENCSLDSSLGLAYLYISIRELPLIYTIDENATLDNSKILSELSKYIFNCKK